MAGLMKDRFVEEVMTELSWIMRAIDDLSEKTGLETIETTLIKYRVQPEEFEAIDHFFARHMRAIDTIPFADARASISDHFTATTGKPWRLNDDVLKKLLTQLSSTYGGRKDEG